MGSTTSKPTPPGSGFHKTRPVGGLQRTGAGPLRPLQHPFPPPTALARSFLLPARQAADSIAAYYAEGTKRADHDVVLSPELGLAIEKLPEGFTAKSLWSMV